MLFLLLVPGLKTIQAAPLCSDVFPAAITEDATTTLNLPSFPDTNDGDAAWENNLALTPGTYYYEDFEIDNNVVVTLSGPVLIYVESGVDIGNNVLINSPGDPTDFVLISYDEIDIGNNTLINGLLYAQDDVELSNNVNITGAVTGEEDVDTEQNTSVTYDSNALNSSLLAGLCEGPNTPLLAIDTFESYPLGSITGMNGGTGWGGSWQGAAGQSIVDNFSNPLIYDDGTGRSIRSQRSLEITGNDNRMATRAIGGTFSGDRYFASMLIRFEGPVQNNDFLGFWVDSPGYGDSPQFGIKTNEGGGGSRDFFVRLDQSGAYSDQLVPGETYLLVAKFSKNGTNYFNDSKLWVNPSCEAPPPTSAQITKTPTNKISSFSEIGLRTTNLDNGQRIQVGQLAAGETWQDVVRCSPGPLLSYRMEEAEWTGATGEVLDDSGNGRHGTPQGGVNTVPNMPNEAAITGNPGTCGYGVFDGNNGGIRENSADSYLNGLEAITVMSWVYNSASLAGNNRGIFTTATPTNKDNRLALRYDVDGFYTGNTNVIKASVFTEDCNSNQECLQVETESDVMAVDQWQHVAMTWSRGGLIRVFVNGLPVGVSVTRGAGGDGPLAGIDWLDIGQGTKSQRWQGRMDEFRIFGYAMTDAEIAAEMNRRFPCESQLDHILIEHDGAGITCAAETVTLQACADADCIEAYTGEVTVDLTSPTSGWTPDPVIFTGGSATVELRHTTADTVTLDAEATSPTAVNLTQCTNSSGGLDCEMVFTDVGVLIDGDDSDADLESPIFRQIAGKPSNVSPPITALQQRVRVVRTDDQTGACVAGLDNETIDANFQYLVPTPSEGLNDNTVTVTGSTGENLTSAGSGKTVKLTFDGNGAAPFHFGSADAGRYSLQVDLEIPVVDVDGNPTGETIPVSDTSNQFVVRPLAIYADDTDNPQAQSAAGDVYKKAGENFPLTFKSLRWTAGSDNDADGLWDSCGDTNLIDPNNYARVPAWTIGQPAADLVLPAGGSNPGLSYGVGNVVFVTGNSEVTANNVSYGEVGIVQLQADGINAFFGENVRVCSPYIGRFIPDRFEIEAILSGTLKNACNNFTYTGQTIKGYVTGGAPEFTIRAMNAFSPSQITQNYTGYFAKLEATDIDLGVPIDNADADQLGADEINKVLVDTLLETGTLADNGDGTLTYTASSNDEYMYLRENNALVSPFDSRILLQLEGVEEGSVPVAYRVAALGLPLDVEVGGTEIRFGRISLENAYGSELLDLNVPMKAEYFDGNGFINNVDDTCSVFNVVDLTCTDDNTSDDLECTNVTVSGIDIGHGEFFTLSAPDNAKTGTLKYTLDVDLWLQYDWDNADNDNDPLIGQDNPTAKATFGIYQGNQHLIYTRESVW